MDLGLKGKVVLVSGGGTGIGREIAKSFAKEGAKIAILGRRAEPLERTRAEIAEGGGECIALSSVDVADEAAFRAAAGAVVTKLGGLDILINNAGINIIKPVMDYSMEEYSRVLDTNLKGVFNGCRIAGEIMKKQGRGGVIINASSFASLIPHTTAIPYAASKAGVSSLTKSFAASLAPYGIRVVGYIPGMIITEMSAADIEENEELYVSNIVEHRLGRPQDLADPVVFLASERASYINGVDIRVDGGKYAVQDTEIPWKSASI